MKWYIHCGCDQHGDHGGCEGDSYCESGNSGCCGFSASHPCEVDADSYDKASYAPEKYWNIYGAM